MRTVKIPGAEGEAQADWSGTAQLRESNEIKVRHRRLVEVAGVAAAKPMEKVQREQRKLKMAGRDIEGLNMSALDLDAGEAGRLMELQDAVIVAALASWTRPEPLPTIETVGDMDQDVYDALAQATREQGAEIAAAVDFEERPDNPPTSLSDGYVPPSEPATSVVELKPQASSPETTSSDGTSTASASPSGAPTTTT